MFLDLKMGMTNITRAVSEAAETDESVSASRQHFALENMDADKNGN